MPPGEITPPILDNVDSALSSAVSFTFSLVRLGRFPDTLHLVPEPAEPFVELTMALTRHFPKYLPYGGRYSSIFPHLTIAQAGESDLLYVEEKIAAILPGLGGIRARCEQLVLIENSSGLWKLMHTFPLVR